MCYNIYIMKKYCFFIAFALILILLTGCQSDRTATVVYTDVPSPLTQMTFRESLPPETYSEYIATYSSETETSPEGHYFTMIGLNGIYADTGVTAPPADFGGGISSLRRDTAVITTTVPESVTADESEEIVTCVTNVPETGETDTSESLSETAEASETAETTTAYTLARPKADTGISVKSTRVSADTSATTPPQTDTDLTDTESSKSETSE